MKSNWKAIVGVLLIYIFGCFSGAISISIFFHHKMAAFLQHPGVVLSAALEKRLTGNLGLDATQKEHVHDYFLENLQHRKELQHQIQPQVQTLNSQTVKQIAAILRPEQVDLFHQNIERFRQHLGANSFNPTTEELSAPQIQTNAPATNSAADAHP